MIRSTRVHLALAGGLLASFVVGCGDRTPDSAVMAPPETQTMRMDDPAITASVQAKYYGSSAVSGDNIDVETNQGVVTLQGQVTSEAAQQEAVSLARSVDGVVRVDDQLQVRAAEGGTTMSQSTDSKNPGWITTQIQSQYYAHPDLKPWNIDVATSGAGVVTLTGRIDDAADRSEAVRIARNTEGVTDVRDELRSGETAGTSGAGDTASSKAESAAESAGNAAENTAGAIGAAASTAADTISDGWITTKIQSQYFLDPDVKGRNINVETTEGVVVLRGTVDSYSARRQAVGMARNTDGVKEVRDELRVEASATGAARSNGAPDDESITAMIQSKYFEDDDVRGSQIDVSVRRGVVTLSGAVQSNEAKEVAMQLAQDTRGVTDVRDRLRVEQPASGSPGQPRQ